MVVLLIPLRQGVSPADIADAIKQGMEGHELQASCSATAFDAYQVRSGYQIVVAGPVGRIMAAANSAHQQHQPFEETDVTDALRAPVLTVKVSPMMPSVRVVLPIPPPAGSGQASMPIASPDPMDYPDGYTWIVMRSTAKNEQVLKPIGWNAPSASIDSGGRGFLSPPTLTAPFEPVAGIISFDFTAFRAMPDADIEVVLMTSAHPTGGYSCKIGSKNRTVLR